MAAHVTRMEAELTELAERIDKLDAFVAADHIFADLMPVDQTLLLLQSGAMKSYRDFLEQRINRAR